MYIRPFLGRRVAAEDCELGGYFIPKGASLLLDLFMLHRLVTAPYCCTSLLPLLPLLPPLLLQLLLLPFLFLLLLFFANSLLAGVWGRG